MRRLLALLVAVTALGAASQAAAAPYTVSACTAANPGNRLFATNDGPHGTCGSNLSADVTAPTGFLSGGSWYLVPPAGTKITGFALSYAAQWSGGTWGSQVDPVFGPYLAGPCPGANCGWLPAPGGGVPFTRAVRTALSLPGLRLVSYCASPGGCSTGWVHSQWKDISVTIDDPQPPAVSGGPSPAWAEWVRGSQPLAFGAADSTGIQRLRAELGSTAPVDRAYACDYGLAAPCSDQDWSGQVDTTAVGDGPQTLRLSAQDAAGNWGSAADRTIKVDNHAPAPPALSVDGGEGVRAAPDWALRWTVPGVQHAPIVAAGYSVCPVTGGDCTTGRAPVDGATLRGSFGVSRPGDYTLRMWLEDAAGNADPDQPSNPVKLRLDGPPGPAQPAAAPRRWLNAGDAAAFREPIAMAPGAAVSASGIAGYAVTVDGSTPGTSVDVPAGSPYGPPPGGWPEGSVVVRARAIAASGLASGEVGQGLLRFDRTAPVTRAYGQGAPGDWQPGPVTVTLSATDALSGMGAADDGRPPEEGGRIVYSLDGGPERTVGGDEAEVGVAGNGSHRVTFRAYDVAGNVSPDRTVVVNVGEPADGVRPAAHGFSARSLGGTTTFRAAETFAAPCPERAVLPAVRDTYVDQSKPAQANDAGGALVVRSAPAAEARALVAFDLPPARGCHVASAELRLHPADAGDGGAVQVLRLASAWDAAATWETRPGVAGPAASGGATADVTRQVADVYRYGDSGLLIRAAGPGEHTYSSREGGRPPELIVSFR